MKCIFENVDGHPQCYHILCAHHNNDPACTIATGRAFVLFERSCEMLSARTFAVLYDLHLAAVWRGDQPSGAFGNWLEARWCESNLPEPEGFPAALSLLGGGGAGIRWYECDGALVGFVRGRSRGCY